jgi:hypothetical protein
LNRQGRQERQEEGTEFYHKDTKTPRVSENAGSGGLNRQGRQERQEEGTEFYHKDTKTPRVSENAESGGENRQGRQERQEEGTEFYHKDTKTPRVSENAESGGLNRHDAKGEGTRSEARSEKLEARSEGPDGGRVARNAKTGRRFRPDWTLCLCVFVVNS